MKCSKCKLEVDNDSKFCGDCGTKVDEYSSNLDNLIRDCASVWFIFGFMKGCSEEKSTPTEFEKLLKKKFPEVWVKYEEVVNYWKGVVDEHDEKNKKTNGSERLSISEIKRIKT